MTLYLNCLAETNTKCKETKKLQEIQCKNSEYYDTIEECTSAANERFKDCENQAIIYCETRYQSSTTPLQLSSTPSPPSPPSPSSLSTTTPSSSPSPPSSSSTQPKFLTTTPLPSPQKLPLLGSSPIPEIRGLNTYEKVGIGIGTAAGFLLCVYAISKLYRKSIRRESRGLINTRSPGRIEKLPPGSIGHNEITPVKLVTSTEGTPGIEIRGLWKFNSDTIEEAIRTLQAYINKIESSEKDSARAESSSNELLSSEFNKETIENAKRVLEAYIKAIGESSEKDSAGIESSSTKTLSSKFEEEVRRVLETYQKTIESTKVSRNDPARAESNSKESKVDIDEITKFVAEFLQEVINAAITNASSKEVIETMVTPRAQSPITTELMMTPLHQELGTASPDIQQQTALQNEIMKEEERSHPSKHRSLSARNFWEEQVRRTELTASRINFSTETPSASPTKSSPAPVSPGMSGGLSF